MQKQTNKRTKAVSGKKYHSLEAKDLAEHGEYELAEIAESNHLNAVGRVCGRDENNRPTVNGPGSRIDGARFYNYDSETQSICIRVDDSRVPEFWLEIRLPLQQLHAYVARELGNVADE